jgi:hypothetical protein
VLVFLEAASRGATTAAPAAASDADRRDDR